MSFDFPSITSGLEPDLSRGKYILSVWPLPAKTGRTSLELLTRPLSFTYDGLLEADEFIKAAEKRRIKLDLALLEDLHRNQLLVPLLKVRRDNPRPSAVRHVEQPEWVGRFNRLDPMIERSAAQGRLIDPASERFVRWERKRPKDLQPIKPDITTKFNMLYSPYQLLALDALRDPIARHASVWRGKNNAKRLDPDYERREDATEFLAAWRSLAVILHAIDSRYRPTLMRTLPDFETWRNFIKVYDAEETRDWLGLSDENLTNLIRVLRSAGRRLDVSGDFFDLIRRAQPKTWDSLEGDARMSMDFRCAAELIEMFVDDLAGRGVRPEPLPSQATQRPRMEDQGIRQRPTTLDSALTGLNLSPYPSLVLGIEGDTEVIVIPRVFDLLEYPLESSNWIHVENIKSVSKELSLLTRYVSRPLLGEDHGEFVLIDRPLTRLLILFDAEGQNPRRYITYAEREKQRKKLLKEVLEDVPPEFRTDLRSKDARLITIRSWNKFPFEFAHFTNGELADGLIATAGAVPPLGRSWLVRELRQQRRNHRPRGGPSANVEKVWNSWPLGYGLSKPKFADSMWPVLKAKIERSLNDPAAPVPPVLRNVRLAIELALHPYRMGFALKKHTNVKR